MIVRGMKKAGSHSPDRFSVNQARQLRVEFLCPGIKPVALRGDPARRAGQGDQAVMRETAEVTRLKHPVTARKAAHKVRASLPRLLRIKHA